jgi:hypothetical protein
VSTEPRLASYPLPIRELPIGRTLAAEPFPISSSKSSTGQGHPAPSLTAARASTKKQKTKPEALAASLIAPPLIAMVVRWFLFAVIMAGYWTSIEQGRDDDKEYGTITAAMFEYAQSATGNLFLMNGGAIIAVLTFVGHFFSLYALRTFSNIDTTTQPKD